MHKISIVLLLFTVLLLAACGTSSENLGNENEQEEAGQADKNKLDGGSVIPIDGFPQLSKVVADNEKVVEMETSMGTIIIKLFPELAPKAVENFITHSQNGYYDGLTFHRVMNDFMIQGGDPDGTGRGGESIYGQPFEDEFSNALFHLRGALAMANSGSDTNGSQFFIVQNTVLQGGLEKEYPDEIVKAYDEGGGTPWLDSKHTVFGQVTEGMEVVDQIAAAEANADNKPLNDIIIEHISVIK